MVRAACRNVPLDSSVGGQRHQPIDPGGWQEARRPPFARKALPDKYRHAQSSLQGVLLRRFATGNQHSKLYNVFLVTPEIFVEFMMNFSHQFFPRGLRGWLK